MLNLSHSLLALLTVVPPFTPEAEQVTGDYLLKVLPETSSVEVTLSISGLQSTRESLELRMPTGFAFVTLEKPLLGGEVRVQGPGSPSIERLDPYAWRVETGGAQQLVLQYRVPLGHRELEAVRMGNDAYEYPYLEEDHGLLVTGTLVLQAANLELADTRVSFELPGDWEVLAPWPAHRRGGFAPPSGRALANDLIAIGDWDRREMQIDDYTAILAVAPGQGSLLDLVAPPLDRLVRAELEIFDVQPNGSYLFLFGRPEMPGFGGSPKSGSMTLSLAPELRDAAPEYVQHLVAHEFFHTWAMSKAPLPGELRWLNEGITDYFAYTTQLQVELCSLADWHAKFAGKLEELDAIQARHTTSLSEAGGPAFFEGGEAYSLTYAGGLVIGAYIDAALQSKGEFDLVDLMRLFMNDERWNDLEAQPRAEDFFAALAEVGGIPLADRVRQLVSSPFDVDLQSLFSEVGVELEREWVTPEASPRANFEGTTVTAIDPRGQGHQVGLRNGDRLLDVNGQQVNSVGDIYQAWRSPLDGHFVVILERAGEELTLEVPETQQVRYRVLNDHFGEGLPSAGR